MHEEMDDEILVERAKSGDRLAFDEMVGACEPRLRSRIERWAQLRIGPRLDIDDVLQETFVRALRSIASFEPRGEDALFRWLCGIAKNALADSARKTTREAVKRAEGIRVSGLAKAGATQSQALRREERFERLAAALERLPQDYREALTLARLDGLTVKEIAAKMDRTPKAVKHLIARGLRELRRVFGETESLHLPDRELYPGGEQRDG